MPQLPPVAAAAFVITLLTVILVTTVIVQVRARRRRMLLAEMVRATAPIPRPTVSTTTPVLEALPDATPSPLRGNDYGRAEREARFRAFDERSSTREAAPGRPGRRLAAQVAHAAAATVPTPVAEPERPMPVAVAVEPLQKPEVVASAPVAAAPVQVVVPPPAKAPGPATPMSTHGGMAAVALDFVAPVVLISQMPVTDIARAAVEVALEEAAAAELEPEPEIAPVLAVPVATPPLAADRTSETLREAIREAVREPVSEPIREARVTVLPPRQVAPALPAILTREMTLGDAARALRTGLTMTDGRQLRRAVAVGAATSVVAAAFAIRGRKR